MRKLKIVLLRQSHLSHLLITYTTTTIHYATLRYNNNINNNINVTIITYSSHNSITIVTYLSATYDNNSIYFTILTFADITISVIYTNSNV